MQCINRKFHRLGLISFAWPHYTCNINTYAKVSLIQFASTTNDWIHQFLVSTIYRIVGKFGRIKFGEFTHFEHLAKKSLANDRFSQMIIIISRNLDDFSLRGSRMICQICQTFPLYGMLITRMSYKCTRNITSCIPKVIAINASYLD